MSTPISRSKSDQPEDLLLARLVGDVAERLRVGESVDLELVIRQHPQYADQLRELVPAVAALAELDATQAPASTGSDSQPEMGGAIGEYQLLREIGRGGMGIVYEARQLSLNRRVALKVLPFAAALDSRALARFQQESLAAAQLDHPHIVPVYGVGVDRGVHYYAMRYIEGRSLAQVIAEMKSPDASFSREAQPSAVASAAELADVPPDSKSGPEIENGKLKNENCKSGAGAGRGGGTELTTSPDPPAPPLAKGGRTAGSRAALLPNPKFEIRNPKSGSTLAQRAPGISTDRASNRPEYYRGVARLGIQAAEALDYAHAHGILHRDVKPGNLLVDDKGNVWITDFGLARLESAGNLTHTGDLMGTLRYMSPEQALGKRGLVDQRSDVYSLGATLYELLTLTPVMGADDKAELLSQIAHADPQPPRRFDRSIPGELETIVLKCQEKDPADRYGTAQEVADDLQRFLDHQPISARRAGQIERARKWARRHATGVAASLIVTSIGAVTLAVTTSLVWYERDVARLAEKERRIQAQRATESEADAVAHRVQAEREASRAFANFESALRTIDLMLTDVNRADDPSREGVPAVAASMNETALRLYSEFIRDDAVDPAQRLESAMAYARIAQLKINQAAVMAKVPHAGEDANDQRAAIAALQEQATLDVGQAIRILNELAAHVPPTPTHQRELAQSYFILASVRPAEDSDDDLEHLRSRRLLIQKACVLLQHLVDTGTASANDRHQLAMMTILLEALREQPSKKPFTSSSAFSSAIQLLGDAVKATARIEDVPGSSGVRDRREQTREFYLEQKCRLQFIEAEEHEERETPGWRGAEQAYRRAMDTANELPVALRKPNDVTGARCHQQLVRLLLAMNHLDEAARVCEEIAAFCERVLVSLPGDAAHDLAADGTAGNGPDGNLLPLEQAYQVAVLLESTGDDFLSAGRRADAHHCWGRAWAIYQNAFCLDDAAAAQSFVMLNAARKYAAALVNLKMVADAEAIIGQALRCGEKRIAALSASENRRSVDWAFANCLRMEGDIAYHAGRPQSGRLAHKAAINLGKRLEHESGDRRRPGRGFDRLDLVALQLAIAAVSPPQDAELHLQNIVEQVKVWLEGSSDGHHHFEQNASAALALWRLGQLEHSLGRMDDASRHFAESLERFQDRSGVTRLECWDEQGTYYWAERHARHLVSCPVTNLRDAVRALELARRLVQSDWGKTSACWLTLAVAEYCAGNFEAALTALNRSMLVSRGTGSHCFLAAIIHLRLGHDEEARRWYARASAWPIAYGPLAEEISWFRNEALVVFNVTPSEKGP